MMKSLHANMNYTYSCPLQGSILSVKATTSCDCLKGACPYHGFLFLRFLHGKLAERIAVLHELAPAAPELA